MPRFVVKNLLTVISIWWRSEIFSPVRRLPSVISMSVVQQAEVQEIECVDYVNFDQGTCLNAIALNAVATGFVRRAKYV